MRRERKRKKEGDSRTCTTSARKKIFLWEEGGREGKGLTFGKEGKQKRGKKLSGYATNFPFCFGSMEHFRLLGKRGGKAHTRIFATILQFPFARIQFALPPPVPLQDLKFKTTPLLFPEMRKSLFLRFSPFPSAGELSPPPPSSPQKDERRELF